MTATRGVRRCSGPAARRWAAGALLLPLAFTASSCASTEPKPPDANDGGGSPESHPAVGVCFYDAPRYEGARYCVELTSFTTDVVNLALVGEAASTLKRGIASVEVFGKIAVLLFPNEFGQGESVVVAESAPTLPLFGARASFEIDDVNECLINNGDCDAGREACTNKLDGHDCDPVEVCFYTDPKQEGTKQCYGPIAGPVDLPTELDNNVSSVSVTGPAVVTIYKGKRGQDLFSTVTETVDQLGSFDDAIRSFSVKIPGLDTLPSAEKCKTPSSPSDVPRQLSETGCFHRNQLTGAYTVPAAELLPYDVNAPAWADGALASRWILAPGADGRPLPAIVRADGGFDFAPGTMLWQELKVDGRRVETRLLMKRRSVGQGSDAWDAYTYAWRQDQMDADLELNGLDEAPADSTWHVPSQADCLHCHASSTGFEARQLDRAKSYMSGRSGPQLDTLLHLGMMIFPESVDAETARFPLDEGEGNVVGDPARPSLASTIMGTPMWVEDSTRLGEARWALYFDENAYVATNVPNASTRTLAAWIRPASSDPLDYIESVIDSDIPGQYGTGFGVNDGYIVAILDNEFWYTRETVTLHEWQHVALAFDAQSATLYIDGDQVATLSYRQGDVSQSTYLIGRSLANGYSFHGEIADVRIFSSLLSAEDVRSVYKDTLQGVRVAPPKIVALPDPFGESGDAPLDQRARAWLHTNCSLCHRPGGAQLDLALDLRFDTRLDRTMVCSGPRYGTAGIEAANPLLVAPEAPDRSVLLARIKSTNDGERMPPISSHVVDERGVDLISRWIQSLRGC